MIGKTLDEGSTFERVGSRQLAGLLIAVWSVLFIGISIVNFCYSYIYIPLLASCRQLYSYNM